MVSWCRSNYYFGTRSFAFALLIGTLLNVVLVAMLNISIELEDPFDNLGLLLHPPPPPPLFLARKHFCLAARHNAALIE